MQIASVATVSGWITSFEPSRIATVSGLPSVWLRWMFSIVTVALSTSSPIASASPPSVIRLMVWPVRNRPGEARRDRQRNRQRHDHGVPPAAEEDQDHQRDQDRGQDRLVDDVVDRALHEHRLVEVELELEALRRRGLDLRQDVADRLDHGDRRGVRVLQDVHVARALAVDAHGVLLGGEAVADLGDVAERHRQAVAHADRQRLELLDHLRAGVELDVELALADAGDAGRHDDVGGLQRADHVHLRQALGAQPRGIDVDDDLALLAAVGRRDRQARDGEQLARAGS